jgi:hypothetical protein
MFLFAHALLDSTRISIWNLAMSKQKNRIPPALKHGCYSSLGLLPTEDRAAYEQMRRDINAEYNPSGRSEEIIVSNLSDYLWRRENLQTYRLALTAHVRRTAIYSELMPPNPLTFTPLGFQEETRSPEELKALRKTLDEQVKRELGPVQELIEVADLATSEELVKHLELLEHLDKMVARCLKQLMMIRGFKSLGAAA